MKLMSTALSNDVVRTLYVEPNNVGVQRPPDVRCPSPKGERTDNVCHDGGRTHVVRESYEVADNVQRGTEHWNPYVPGRHPRRLYPPSETDWGEELIPGY